MSDILRAITLLVDVFRKYAGREGDPDSLTKPELRELLDRELRGFLTGEDDQKKLDELFKDLDENKDNTVSFQEFGTLVLTLATICEKYGDKKARK
ncbi:ictacalcin-like [Antennarius striatus]|uniref:ictacalcin-like n=1 Tax=Antennarius striatus TaxID=241820 RepID=UPI0035B23593